MASSSAGVVADDDFFESDASYDARDVSDDLAVAQTKAFGSERSRQRDKRGGGGASVYSTADDAQKLERARVADDLAAFDDALRARDDAE